MKLLVKSITSESKIQLFITSKEGYLSVYNENLKGKKEYIKSYKKKNII